MVEIDPLEAWGPPTFVASGLCRTLLAWCTNCIAFHKTVFSIEESNRFISDSLVDSEDNRVAMYCSSYVNAY